MWRVLDPVRQICAIFINRKEGSTFLLIPLLVLLDPVTSCRIPPELLLSIALSVSGASNIIRIYSLIDHRTILEQLWNDLGSIAITPHPEE